jgi:hypothetical protein
MQSEWNRGSDHEKEHGQRHAKVNVTFCVQLSEDGQRNEIKKVEVGNLRC